MSRKRQKKDPELRALAQKIEAQLHSIRRRLRRSLEAEYARGQVTGPQRLVMEALVRSEGMSLKELSAAVSLAHSTVSGIVDRLQARGMVERRPGTQDRRITQVRVTKAVRDFMQRRVPELTLHPLVAALERASAADLKAVQAGLDTLEVLLDEE
jgi:DNA-binding MarR family transcriptional regulator